jgi:uncharacterized protein YdeI (YjbR/CyaY-like superfamily)
MKFRAELESNGKTATGFVVPEEIVDRLGAGRRPKVKVTIEAHTYRSSIASMGGRKLAGDEQAKAFYESLSYSQQQTFALPIGDAKTDETRQRRVDKAMAALREGRKRP